MICTCSRTKVHVQIFVQLYVCVSAVCKEVCVCAKCGVAPMCV